MRRALLLLLLAPFARGDEEVAQFFLKQAREAIDAGDLDKAAHWIGRAKKKEEGDYAPALLLAADVAMRRGRREEAVRCLEAALARGGRDGLSASERLAVREAKKKLAELDAARFELQKILDEYVRKVVGVARASDDAELTRACWKSVLLVRPGHAEAKKGLGGLAPELDAGDAIFNGKDFDGWNGSDPSWTVKRDVLTGTVEDGGNVNRFETAVKGDYSIVCEARVEEDRGPVPGFAILFGLKHTYDHFGLWVKADEWTYQQSTKPGAFDSLASRKFRNEDDDFDRFPWNTYRIDVQGKRVTAYVNGKRLFSTSGAIRALDGWVALLVQDQTAQFRNVRLVRK